MPGNFLRKRRIGVAREHRDRQRTKFIILLHRPCSKWLGWKDSNLRMAGSKPASLPLGQTPTFKKTDDRPQPLRHPSSKDTSISQRTIKLSNSTRTLLLTFLPHPTYLQP